MATPAGETRPSAPLWWPPDRPPLLRLDRPAGGPLRWADGGPELARVEVRGPDGRSTPLTGLRSINLTVTTDAVELSQHDPAVGLTVHTRCTALAAGMRMRTEIRNDGPEPVTLTAVAAARFAVPCPAADLHRVRLLQADNTWCAENRWQVRTAAAAGFVDTGHAASPLTRVALHRAESSSHSTARWLPSGLLHDADTGVTWAWSVASNAAWYDDITHDGDAFVVEAGGPSDGWWHTLPPGGSWLSRAVTVVRSDAGVDGAFAELTACRRAARRDCADNRELPVIFNDYMNCLSGDPTTDKLLPLIDAAADVGAEYFVIDAGWYSDEPSWWDSVGAWTESARRFPGGLREVTDRIHAHGLVPGLWIEPEVMGVRSPAVSELPAEAYFQRNGRPLEIRGRRHLDFRHPAVPARMDAVIDRLVGDYGLGYLKFDYNIGVEGTDVTVGLAPAEALLGHSRAYLAWVDGLLRRHPKLVIENCSSGGTRADDDQMSRSALLSTSDQTDPLRYVPIAAAAPSAVPPEQAAVWAYPQPDHDPELTSLCLVNALLGRIHLSGRLDRMSAEQRDRVRTALNIYRDQVRAHLPVGQPCWPLGLPGWTDDWVALAVRDGPTTLLAVWRRGGPQRRRIPLPGPAGPVTVEPLFPRDRPTGLAVDTDGGGLTVELPTAPAARLLRIRPDGR